MYDMNQPHQSADIVTLAALCGCRTLNFCLFVFVTSPAPTFGSANGMDADYTNKQKIKVWLRHPRSNRPNTPGSNPIPL